MSFPSPGYLPDPGIEPMSLASLVLPGRYFTTEPREAQKNSEEYLEAEGEYQRKDKFWRQVPSFNSGVQFKFHRRCGFSPTGWWRILVGFQGQSWSIVIEQAGDKPLGHNWIAAGRVEVQVHGLENCLHWKGHGKLPGHKWLTSHLWAPKAAVAQGLQFTLCTSGRKFVGFGWAVELPITMEWNY